MESITLVRTCQVPDSVVSVRTVPMYRYLNRTIQSGYLKGIYSNRFLQSVLLFGCMWAIGMCVLQQLYQCRNTRVVYVHIFCAQIPLFFFSPQRPQHTLKERNIAETDPAKFAAMLIEKLEAEKAKREAPERVRERFNSLEVWNEIPPDIDRYFDVSLESSSWEVRFSWHS